VAQDSGGRDGAELAAGIGAQGGPRRMGKRLVGFAAVLRLRAPAAEDPPPYEQTVNPKSQLCLTRSTGATRQAAGGSRPGHLDAAASPGPRLTWRAPCDCDLAIARRRASTAVSRDYSYVL
jgi:hypothetical protein